MGYATIFQNEVALTLYQENPQLTARQARDYARRIALCELQDDYVQMHRLIQEALYGKGEKHAA
jgi:hypothetical protein